MIIVTGGAGLIGSNLVKGLNDEGREDILIVDNLRQGEKFRNLQALRFTDYQDKERFLADVSQGRLDDLPVEAIFHQGACSDTMEYDGRYMMDNNYEYSKELLHFAARRSVPFLYASSASVYGDGARGFREEPGCEGALNIYGFSKQQFDNYVRRQLPGIRSQVVGLRYFNVFGPQENHKQRMASIVYQLYRQWQEKQSLSLFRGTDGYGDGEQRRDFIYVKDVVKVNLFFARHPEISGIFNCGTGHAHTFNAVAHAVLAAMGGGTLNYVDFPEVLRGKYQSFTEADDAHLLAAGYDGGFTPLAAAVAEYCACLQQTGGYWR